MNEMNGSEFPPQDHNLNYYQEYCRLFIANVVLTTQMKELTTEKNSLESQLTQIEKEISELNSKDGSEDDKKKRFRRAAKQIERHFKCPIQSCSKSYGSEGSLNQHMKLKHAEFYQENYKQEANQNQIDEANNEGTSQQELNSEEQQQQR